MPESNYNMESVMLKRNTLIHLAAVFVFALGAQVATAASILADINWLEQHLDDPAVKIIDMMDDTQYQRFHIPGAIHLPYAALNTRNKQGVSLSVGKQKIMRILGLLGIRPDDHVVIYDDMGGLNAGRLFWELERIGHRKISVLDGGLVKWVLAGKKVVADAPRITATRYNAANGKPRNNLSTLEDILKTRFDSKQVLLDVRSQEEYAGHPRYPRSGHIPGARWWEWTQSVDFDNAFSMKKPAIIRQQLAALGLKKTDTPVTVYCRSAHRASQAYLTLRQLGFDNVRLYDGSMAEYSQHKAAPLKQGMQP